MTKKYRNEASGSPGNHYYDIHQRYYYIYMSNSSQKNTQYICSTSKTLLPFRRSFGSLFKDEIRAALGCAPAISTRPKHFHSSLSTNSTPRMCGNRGLGTGSCTPGSVNGGGTTLTTTTTSPGTYRHNNGAGVSLVGNRGTSSNTTNKHYPGGSSRNGLVYFGNSNSTIFKILKSQCKQKYGHFPF